MNVNALLEIAPLVQGKVLDRRIELRDNIVRYILSSDNCPTRCTPEKIVETAKSEFSIQLDEGLVTASLDNLVQEEIIEHETSNIYRILSEPESPDIKNLIHPVWLEYKQIVEAEDPEVELINIDQDIEKAFRLFLNDYVDRIASSTIDLGDIEVDSLIRENLNDNIEKVVDEANVGKASLFKRTMKDYIKNPGDELQKFTGIVYNGIVNIDLISREVSIDFEEISGSKKVLFLDTNILVSLMCEEDSLHPIISSTCRKSRRMGYDLYYLPWTAEEMDRFVYASIGEAERWLNSGGNNVIRSQFLEDYIEKDNVSWNDYKSELNNWRQVLETIWNIYEYEEEVDINDEKVDNARHILKHMQQWGNEENITLSEDNRLNHDAKLLGLTATLRDTSDIDPAEGPFILSFHGIMTSVSRIGEQTFWERGLAIQPRNWLNYINAFSAIEFDENSRKEVARAIIKSSANFDETWSIDEYTKYLRTKLGLDENSQGLLKDYILSTPLSRELERALSENEAGQVERIAREIVGSEQFLENFKEQKELDERVDQLSQSLRDYKSRYEKERERRREAEKIVSEIGDVNIEVDVSAVAESTSEVEGGSNIATEYIEFVKLLNAALPQGIQGSDFENPPEETTKIQDIITWLNAINVTFHTVDNLPENVASLQPYAQELLMRAQEFM